MIKNYFSTFVACALVFAISLIGLQAQSKVANNSEVMIKTSAFSYMCKDKIENKIKDLDGVEDGFLNLDDKVITIQYDAKKVSTEKLSQIIKNMGYDADILQYDTAKGKNSKEEPIRTGTK